MRAWLQARSRRRAARSLLAAVALGLLLAAWLRGAGDGPVAPVSFVTYGVASAPSEVPLRSLPGGGEVLAQVPAGSRVGVGGRVPLLGGASRADALWVASAADGRVLHGFVPERAVVIVAGHAPVLDLDDVAVGDLVGESRVVAAAAPQGDSRDGIAWLPSTLEPWEPFFEAAGAEHGVDPDLLAIITLVESGGRPEAVSGAGAVGLMQIMPATASDIARWRGLDKVSDEELSQPGVNIDYGAFYVARMLSTFGVREDPDWERSVEVAAAAYNGGPGAAERWLAGGTLPDETERYRAYVLGMWRERDDPRSPTFAAWCRAGGHVLVPAGECPEV